MAKAQTRAGGTPPAQPPKPTQKEKFEKGEELRDGTDVSKETYYKDEIDNKKLGVDTDATQAAVYDESGLDPYEIANAQ